MIEEIEEIMDEDDSPRLNKLKKFAKICVDDIWSRIFLAGSRFSIRIKLQEDTNQITVEVIGDHLHKTNNPSRIRGIKDPFIYILEPEDYTSEDEVTIGKIIEDDLSSRMGFNPHAIATINTSNPKDIKLIGRYLDD